VRFTRGSCVHGISIAFPPLILIRASVAAVWLYEGLWCKILGRVQSQVRVVTAVPRLGPRLGSLFLRTLGVVEVALAVWVMVGVAPGVCAIVETGLLIVLNASGLLWARHIIFEPAGMVVKNIAFLILVWVCGAIPGGRL
jgi:DoxX-like family